jgi:hypothetical protein
MLESCENQARTRVSQALSLRRSHLPDRSLQKCDKNAQKPTVNSCPCTTLLLGFENLTRC